MSSMSAAMLQCDTRLVPLSQRCHVLHLLTVHCFAYFAFEKTCFYTLHRLLISVLPMLSNKKKVMFICHKKIPCIPWRMTCFTRLKSQFWRVFMCRQEKTWNTSCGCIRESFYKRRPRRPPFLRVESDGIGVTSSILPIFMPERAKALRADWAPGPGVLVRFPPVARSLMCRAVIPKSLHFSATSCLRQWHG